MASQIRNSYAIIKKKYRKIKKGTVRLTQSSLLLEQLIDATKDVYKFPVLETDPGSGVGNAILPEEIRLNINDEFIAYDVAYYLVADKTLAPAPEVVVGRHFFSYAADELTSAFAVLEDAWLGALSIVVNKISRLERWDLKKHNFIPRTQFQSTSAGIPAATQPSIDYSQDGCIPMQPMLTLSGAKKNDIVINLVHAISATTTGVWTPPTAVAITFAVKRICLIFRGMLAQNAAKFQ
jgi:hypothetical protein